MIKKILKSIWNAIKFPVTLAAVFFCCGLFFALGVSNSDTYRELLSGKYIIITTIEKDELTKKDDE
jgi:hypothetical protein